MMRERDHFDRDLRELPLAPADACPGAERLAAFYDGQLGGADEDAVRAHLALCPTCLELAREAREFLATLGPSAATTRRRRAWWGAAAAVAAGLSLVGIVGSLRDDRGLTIVAAPYTPLAESAASPSSSFRGPADPERFAAAMGPYARGDYAAAETALEAYVLRQPDDDRARFYLAVTRLVRGNAHDALRDLHQLSSIADSPLHEDVAWYHALALWQTGERAQAEALLRALAGADGPHSGDARRVLLGEP